MGAASAASAAGDSVFGTGQQVRRVGDGEIGTITSVSDGLATVAFGSRTVTVHEDDLEAAPSSPAELLAEGTLQDSTAHYLRYLATCLGHAYRYDPLAGLSNARIEPEPHQVYVAHRVTNKLRPRMILADEVGLGKTIEAGLILKELRARQVVERVLIVTPASLTRQWHSELKS